MSKKDKSKFKKQIKAQILQEMQQAQRETFPTQPHLRSGAKMVEPEVQPVILKQAPVQAIAQDSTINLPQIIYDLKKTAIIVGSFAILIAVLYFLDLKFGILLNFGNLIFKVLHIQ